MPSYLSKGLPAPDFRLTDTRGMAVQLSEFRIKKNVVLVLNRGFV
jgi:peroxiredoxin